MYTVRYILCCITDEGQTGKSWTRDGEYIKYADLGLSLFIPTHKCKLVGSRKIEPVCPKNQIIQSYTSDDLHLYSAETEKSGTPWFCSLSPSKGWQQPHTITAEMVTCMTLLTYSSYNFPI
jgi:hypothetical protein